MNYLGVDFGLKRIGVAFSQGDLAEPVGTFTAETQEKRVTLVKELADRHNVAVVVVGTTAGTLKGLIDSFIAALQKDFNGTIIVREEAMTTVEAQKQLIDQGLPKKKRQANIDAYAAVIILQSYLDEQHA